jgi:hypothetical protein
MIDRKSTSDRRHNATAGGLFRRGFGGFVARYCGRYQVRIAGSDWYCRLLTGGSPAEAK